MKAIGIVAEYNPFHNGHLYHLQTARKACGVAPTVCVMSGNFTQRGEAALCDKWTRAEMAVRCGVDLVIELPFLFAVRSAEGFASGALRLLDALGIVSHLAFGSECADLVRLQAIAKIAVSPQIQMQMKQNLKKGYSYAAALSGTLGAGNEAIIKSPNNILAIEYLKAIEQFKLSLEPLVIERQVAQYHDQEIHASIASATAIRAQLAADIPDFEAICQAIPEGSQQYMIPYTQKKLLPPTNNRLSFALLAKLRCMKRDELATLAGISEGLEYKILHAAPQSGSVEELLEQIRSKRYPKSRLQRLLLYILFNIKKKTISEADLSGPLYVRVLAFNSVGRELLKEIKQSCALPLVIKTSAYLTTASRSTDDLSPLAKMLAIDTYATDLYALHFLTPSIGALDFTRSPRFFPIPSAF